MLSINVPYIPAYIETLLCKLPHKHLWTLCSNSAQFKACVLPQPQARISHILDHLIAQQQNSLFSVLMSAMNLCYLCLAWVCCSPHRACVCLQEIDNKMISPEKVEEAKLKTRYPHLGAKPGGSDFLRKRLQKGVSLLNLSSQHSLHEK